MIIKRKLNGLFVNRRAAIIESAAKVSEGE
jgi:hypothetical protein